MCVDDYWITIHDFKLIISQSQIQLEMLKLAVSIFQFFNSFDSDVVINIMLKLIFYFHLWRLSYKLTHLYYNWPGTIRVPAPCQVCLRFFFFLSLLLVTKVKTISKMNFSYCCFVFVTIFQLLDANNWFLFCFFFSLFFLLFSTHTSWLSWWDNLYTKILHKNFPTDCSFYKHVFTYIITHVQHHIILGFCGYYF